VAAQDADGLAALDIPEPQGCITAAADQPLPIRAKLHTLDCVGVAAQDADGLAALDIPEPDRPVQAPARQERPIRAHGNR
jgi:hypothetical protein